MGLQAWLLTVLVLLVGRERKEAAANLRQAQAGPLSSSAVSVAAQEGQPAGTPPIVAQDSSSALAAGIEELLAALKPRRDSTEGSRSEDGSVINTGKSNHW